MKKYYILMLNDGTDEIFNLNGIECTSLEDFKSQYKEFFDGEPMTDRFFYLCLGRGHWTFILDTSNQSFDNTEGEYALLSQLQQHFMTYTQLKKKLPLKQ